MASKPSEVIEMLKQSYSMEIETVMNYLANSIHLDGVRAEEIKKVLAADVNEELMHATMLGNRIKQLGGSVPGSLSVAFSQQQLQPPEDSTDVVGVISAVVEAEHQAVEQYRKIIRATEGDDYVTQDLCVKLMTDEEQHLVLFKGFRKEYAKDV